MWTDGVKFALIRAAKHFDYEVNSTINNIDVNELPERLRPCYENLRPHYGEWLYGLTACDKDHDKKWHLPMVAECEWKPEAHINEDFEKLPLARAGLRVMVYNDGYIEDAEFLNWLRLCENNEIGDIYLLAASVADYENNSWSFRYTTINFEPTITGRLQPWQA